MNAVGLAVLLAMTPVLAQNTGRFPKTRGMPWPMPQFYYSQSTFLQVDKTLRFSSNLKGCDIIDQAFKRYIPYITTADCARNKRQKVSVKSLDVSAKGQKLATLDVTVLGKSESWITSSSDEKYDLQVNMSSTQGTASIRSNTVWGALRGLETFSQLVYDRGDGVLQVNTTVIHDYPRFTFRGILLDTSRHFLPVRVLYEHLEAMAQNKMNVFHWHIVDDQSFPYVSTAFPKLSSLGAYGPKHVYTPQDVARVIEFARLRGIRVIPEFDSPGHTQSWGFGQPGLLTPCYKNGILDGTFGPVNPVLNSTYDFFRKFFTELSTAFPDPYIHLGGDEVSFNCWKSNPAVLAFMKANGMGDNFKLLEDYYFRHILDILASLTKNGIVWQEIFDHHVRLPKTAIVNVWLNGYLNELAAVTKAGYKTILSSPWYLNYISYGKDWPKYYAVEPLNFTGTEAQKQLVLGGSACMWGEFVDANNLMAITWPRASAVAERLWSPRQFNDPKLAGPRLEEHSCRMMKRGLTVQPVNGPSSCDCDVFN